jgi:hypothetical protein
LVGDPLQETSREGGRRGRQRRVGRIRGHEIEPGTVRRRVAQVVAMTAQHADVSRSRFERQVPRERGLADAGLAAEENEPPMTGEGRRQLLAQEDLLPRPAGDHACAAAGRGVRLPDWSIRGCAQSVHGCLAFCAGGCADCTGAEAGWAG